MRITRYTDYAFRILIHLAVHPGGRASVPEIAAAFHVSPHHLTKVARRLQSQGYIGAVRGRGGGLFLRHAPADINLGEVVRDMEADLRLVECFGNRNACVITPFCQLRTVFGDALTAFFDVLDRHTLADLVAERRRAGLRRQLGIKVVD